MQIAVVAALAAVLASRLPRGAAQLQVTQAPVTSGPIVRRIVATGTLEPMTTVEIGSQVSGTIKSLGADYNSIVHAGDVLARLDPSLYDAALRQANAMVASARADMAQLATAVEDAERKQRRDEQLLTGSLIPQADADADRATTAEARAALHAGEARVAQAAAAEAEAAQNLRLTVIRCPVDGIVIERNVDVGQTVASALQSPVLFKVAADFTRMQIIASIDEAEIGGVVAGEPVTFTVDAYPGDAFSGRVSSVRLQPVDGSATAGSPPASPTSPSGATPSPPAQAGAAGAATSGVAVVAYPTVIDVANPDQRLRPGMTALVTLNGMRRDEAIRIPNAALSFRPPVGATVRSRGDEARAKLVSDARTARVWTFSGGAFTPIEVKTGLADDRWTEVVDESLQPGDALVASAVVENGAAPERAR